MMDENNSLISILLQADGIMLSSSSMDKQNDTLK